MLIIFKFQKRILIGKLCTYRPTKCIGPIIYFRVLESLGVGSQSNFCVKSRVASVRSHLFNTKIMVLSKHGKGQRWSLSVAPSLVSPAHSLEVIKSKVASIVGDPCWISRLSLLGWSHLVLCKSLLTVWIFSKISRTRKKKTILAFLLTRQKRSAIASYSLPAFLVISRPFLDNLL